LKNVDIGIRNAEEAARAYDTAASRTFGASASLNFPDDYRPVGPSLGELRANNTSGFVGVSRVVAKGKVRWIARIHRDGKTIHVGTFDSLEIAAAARANRLASMEVDI
jgi:hypothetical protein